jgi:hypothetical protein
MHRVHCVLDVLLYLDTHDGSTQTIPGKSYCHSGASEQQSTIIAARV